MKTKKLIEMLQKADPSGEHEVSVQGIDIGAVYIESGYYDGAYQIISTDDDNNIIKAKITDKGKNNNISIFDRKHNA